MIVILGKPILLEPEDVNANLFPAVTGSSFDRFDYTYWSSTSVPTWMRNRLSTNWTSSTL
jgi:hypothetical protein